MSCTDSQKLRIRANCRADLLDPGCGGGQGSYGTSGNRKRGLPRRGDRAASALPRDGAGAPLFYREPLHIVRGEGAYLFDAAGRRYVDMYNSVPCVGHAHPLIVEAMAAQQATLNVHSRHLHEGILELAERITELHGERLESVVFLCTGTEANEMALRMARAATGWRGIVCSGAAYHGTSAVVGKLTHVHPRTPERGTEVRGFPFPQTHRPLAGGPIDEPIEELRARYLDRLPAAIDDLTNDGVGFAGSVCPIFASEGLPTVPDGFMPRAAAIARGWGMRWPGSVGQ